MKQPYGRMSRAKTTKGPSADRLIVDIKDRHTLEQFSLELQKMIARLQEHGAHGVEACSVYLKPLDAKGERIALWNDKGEPISRMEVSAQTAVPAYRLE